MDHRVASDNGSHIHDNFKMILNDDGPEKYSTICTAKSPKATQKVSSGTRRYRFKYPSHWATPRSNTTWGFSPTGLEWMLISKNDIQVPDLARGEVDPNYDAWFERRFCANNEPEPERPAKRPHVQAFDDKIRERLAWGEKEKNIKPPFTLCKKNWEMRYSIMIYRHKKLKVKEEGRPKKMKLSRPKFEKWE